MIKSINLEGVDKVGKHTATIATLKILLLSQYSVVMLDAPQYWFFGSISRKALNTENFEMDKKREIELRCILYILDRLFSFIILSPYLKLNPDCIVVADRGWASNAVTIGFGLAQQKISEDEIDAFILNLKKWEQEYIENLNPNSILLLTGEKGKSAMEKGTMKREDLYEQPEPQIKALSVYQNHMNLPEVVTQIQGEWRNVVDIAKDILKTADIAYDLNIDNKSLSHIKTEDIIKNKNLFIVGPNNFFKTLYGSEFVELEKILGKDFNELEKASLEGDKEKLREHENKISQYIFANPPKDIYFEIPQPVSEGLKRNITESPEVLEIVKNNCGEKFLEYILRIAK